MSEKKGKVQPNLASFFGGTPKIVTCIRSGGQQKRCRYCGGWFTPQGLPSHEAGHVRKGDAMNVSRSQPDGCVKITGPAYQKPNSSSSVSGAGEGGNGDASADDEEESNATEKRTEHVEIIVNSDGEEEQKVTIATAKSTSFTNAQKIEIIDHYKSNEGKQSKNDTIKWVQKNMNRPKFQRLQLNRLLASESQIRSSLKRDRSKVVREKEGRYPDMEKRLAEWIRDTRKGGVPVETWMIVEEGKVLLHRLYPKTYPCPDDFADDYPFKFSAKWKTAFFERHKFSRRLISKRKNHNTDKTSWEPKANAFHLETRVFQMSKVNDPEWGVAPPECVFNKDQVPIALSPTYASTVDSIGTECVYDAVGNENDFRRFCTLDLVIPMKVADDLGNLPKPGVVFSASKFMSAEDWHDQDEAAEWDDRVVVSFQDNAWVDSNTYQHHLREQMKPIDTWCESKGSKGVTFQDQLSSYLTETSVATFEEALPNFLPPRYYPSQLSFCVQAVDRHVGKVYKMRAYRSIRAEQMRRLREARAGGDTTATISPLSPRDKRIIICKSIADTHEELAKSGMFYRAFIATGTWLPISPLIEDAGINHSVPEEWKQVSLQHLPDYDYPTMCKRQAVFDFKTKQEREQQQEKLQAMEDKKRREEEIKQAWEALGQWLEKGERVLEKIEGDMQKKSITVLERVATVISPPFVVLGSWPAKLICDVMFSCGDLELDDIVDDLPEDPGLIANDIDVYHGNWGDGQVTVHFKDMKYHNLANLDLEVNAVPCSDLNITSLLHNNDINATAAAFGVKMIGGKINVSVHTAPSYWKFLLTEDHVIEPVIPGNCTAKTFVRIAYKAYQMNLPYDMCGVSPHNGTIAKSHREKMETIQKSDWEQQPFRNMVAMAVSKGGYEIRREYKKLDCSKCEHGRANARCVGKWCAKCCRKQDEKECNAHKDNLHQKRKAVAISK